jgi:hypothetical protein
MHKKNQGSIGEALVLAQVLENECACFVDFGDNSKIDLIIEDSDGKLHKVQVKCPGREVKSPKASILYTYKSGPNNYRVSYTKQMVDWFAIVDYDTKKIAWIHIHDCGDNGSLSFRHGEINRNRYKGKIRWFDDYTKFPFK